MGIFSLLDYTYGGILCQGEDAHFLLYLRIKAELSFLKCLVKKACPFQDGGLKKTISKSKAVFNGMCL